MKEVTACPVSSAPPESQGNRQAVGPQALAPRLAALLPACTGAAEFAPRRRSSSYSERAEDWSALEDIPDPDVRGGKIVHALIAYELARFVGLAPEPLDMLHASDTAREVVDKCAGRVKSVFQEAQARGTNPTLLVEHRVDCLAAWGLEGICVGYADSVVVADDTIFVCEYKAGTGPIHYAQTLGQCRLYGLGIINEFGVRPKIVLEILKPGINFDRRVEMTPEELTRWGEETMVPLVRSVMQGERTYRPGLHCPLCPGRPLCRAWVRQMITMLVSRYGRGATVSPQQAPKLSEQEVAELLGLLGTIEACQRPLQEWAVAHIKRGGSIPGYHVHHNPGSLRFYDEAAVTRILQEHGLWAQAQKLRTPHELKKAIGNEAYQMVASYAIRSQGKDVLRRDDTAVGGPTQ